MDGPEGKDRPEPLAPDPRRRSFLKKAGTIVVAAPVMESLSREGLLVKSAHAQSGPAGLEAGYSGPIGGYG